MSDGKDLKKVVEKKFKLEDFEFKYVLGKGTFGEVNLMVHLPTETPYAVKVIKKENITNNKQIEHIKNEK